MHDPLIRRLASNGKVKSAATRGPGLSWPGSAPQAEVFSGFQYPTPPLRADAEAKRKAIENAYEPLTPDAFPDWTHDSSLITWLDSLGH
jgi:hypothetical protein